MAPCVLMQMQQLRQCICCAQVEVDSEMPRIEAKSSSAILAGDGTRFGMEVMNLPIPAIISNSRN